MMTQQDLFETPLVYSSYQQDLFREIQQGTGHVLVRAVAGSGKTTTIVQSIEFIPKDKTVLLCAFNREICRTLEKKVKREADVETFHAIGYRAVKRSWGRTVALESSRNRDILSQILQHRKISLDRPERSQILQLVSLAKSYLAWEDKQLETLYFQYGLDSEFREKAKSLFDVVRQCLTIAGSNTGSVSFDDMIYAPLYAKLPLKQYDIVLVDETQDLNYAQWTLAKKSINSSGRIIAVGDEHQAIYGFRGARPNAMTEAAQELNAKTMPLSVTYRCPRAVVAIAKKYVPEIEAAPDAAYGVAREVDSSILWKEIEIGDLVLSRVNKRLISLCLKAVRRKIPSRILGRNLSETLCELIERSEKRTVEGLLVWLDAYKQRERERLIAIEREDAIEELLDRVGAVQELCDGLTTTQDAIARIETLCVDDPKVSAVRFSSVHRAKGLEANRVWVAQDTFQLNSKNPARRHEEENLFYVAVTRAKRDLSLFSGT